MKVKKDSDNGLSYASIIVQEVKEKYVKKDKKLIFIIDQINFLNSLGFKFLNELLKFNKCIISASDSNLQYNDPIKTLKKSTIHKITPKITFSTNEFKLFYQSMPHYLGLNRDQNPELVFDEDDINKIMSVTGAIPIELFFFIHHLTTNGTLTNCIAKYNHDFNQNRYPEREIYKWFETLPEKHKKLALANIVRLINETGFADSNNIYDRRIIFEYQKDNKSYLRTINQVALNNIVNFSYFDRSNELKDLFIGSIRSKLPQTVKGSVVEHFIIQSIANHFSRSRALKFKVHIGGKNEVAYLEIKDYVVELFVGKKAPATGETNVNTVFVPRDPTYPAFDVFYYDNDSDNLFCIQITLNEKPMTHVDSNDVKFDSPEGQFKQSMNEWITFLKDETTFIEIWIVKRTSYEADDSNSAKKKNLNVIYFDE
jgi:hypothetical protein